MTTTTTVGIGVTALLPTRSGTAASKDVMIGRENLESCPSCDVTTVIWRDENYPLPEAINYLLFVVLQAMPVTASLHRSLEQNLAGREQSATVFRAKHSRRPSLASGSQAESQHREHSAVEMRCKMQKCNLGESNPCLNLGRVES
ncbi:hypothetical protein CONLIGDRAFT_637680 [Coniochaeta ligniaria NRRL 30616]|uniref:Uncharacterized protein n=1 Tax=Coniochaeta ligniaria NRRL 30616 TaxID=1408157 RepID=A0A1J7J874_9PEZI|nr:hypothetical protein CONLIGDRAFT_637680 [Coniochaeta ligniaria NRRL 30616]